ncbi:MAG: type II toxin-antitoxin system death-on-curing family toxin [Bacteroidota bacterium]
MRPKFIPDELASRIHFDLIRRYGGRLGVRDRNLLASALAQPKMTAGGKFLHKTVFSKAAAYAFHVCKNHPFVDGNKRTAFVLMAMFLDLNGWNLDASEEKAYSAMMAVADGSMSKSQLAGWLKEHTSRSSR